MNEMRKLMEAIEQINEGWDVKGIAKAIHDEWSDEGSPISRAAKESQEPFRAAVYEFGYSSRLFNPDTLDGSEIWHDIINELERLSSGAIEEEDVHPSEDHWPHDKPYPKTPPVSPDLANADVENFIEKAAMALAKDAIVQAAGVYDEEGPGEGKFATGAKSRDEYVRIAAHRFLDKDYKKAILVNFQQQFSEYVDYWLDET